MIPGAYTYAEATIQRKQQERQPEQQHRQRQSQQPSTLHKTVLISDSVCRSIRNRDIKMSIDRRSETSITSKHPGATANQIKHYNDYFLKEEKPNRVIISAGLNDLLYERDGNIEEIVDRVVDIGKRAKESGVSDIFILGLYKPEEYVNIKDFNSFLMEKCTEYNFGFVPNSNIELGDLFDGLHVNNKSGNKKLKHNILQCFKTYNYNPCY